MEKGGAVFPITFNDCGGIFPRRNFSGQKFSHTKFPPPLYCTCGVNVSPQVLSVCMTSVSAPAHTPTYREIAAIVHDMKRRPKCASLHTKCCYALWQNQLAGYNAKAMTFRAGGIAVILEAMQSHVKDLGASAMSCMVLWELAMDHENEAILLSVGAAVLHILRILHEHQKVAPFRAYCCGMLCDFLTHDRTALILRHSGVEQAVLVRTVVHHMAQHVTDCELQRVVCGALARLSVRIIGEPATTTAVLNAMKQHEGDATVQETGCRYLLGNALRQTRETGDEFRNIPLESGALPMLFAAMRLLVAKKWVQLAGCLAIASAARDAQTALLSIGVSAACALVLRAMERHATDDDVQQFACLALEALSERPAHRDAMGRAGVIAALVGCMEHHAANVLVQMWGCEAVGNLLKDEGNKHEV